MQKLTERSEIAMAINFRKYPVVPVDVSNRDDYGIRGTPVCIDSGKFTDGNPYLIRATLRTYNDSKTLQFSASVVGISSSFTYHDMDEMLTYVNAPTIKPDQDILICPYNSSLRVAYSPIVLHTGKAVSRHCSTPLSLEKFEIL